MNDIGSPWHSTEAAESYRKSFPVFFDQPAFDIVGFDQEKIGLPITAILDLKKKVIAAAISNRLRISIGHAEERYVNNEEISPPRDAGLSHKIDRIFDQGHSLFCEYVDELKKQIQSHTLDDLSNQFFYRNIAGLDATKRLSELGYLCEIAVILRSMLEQFAFAARIGTLPFETDLGKVRPIQCLNCLKTIEPATGRLYGLLSKYTHFEFDHHTHFFARSADGIFTIQKDSVLRAFSTHLIFLTMLSMAKYVLSAAPTQFSNIARIVAGLHDFVQRIADYSKEVCALLPGDEVLAQFDSSIRLPDSMAVD